MTATKALLFASTITAATAFSPNLHQTNVYALTSPTSSTTLFGAFNKGNKQAELMKKMAAAKKQREQAEGISEPDESNPARSRRLSDEEMKKQNDLKRFKQLLDNESATVNYDISGTNYKTQAQEEEELDANDRGIDRLFEGDPAPTLPFENLIPVMNVNGNALGKNGASRIVPWLNKSAAKQGDYLIVVTDPRNKSSEMRTALKNMAKLLTADILSRLIVINADTVGENKRFLKKNNIDNVNIFCDEKREWMREYTVLGEKRWAMCMMVLKEGRVEKLVREVDVELASQVIKTSISSLKA